MIQRTLRKIIRSGRMQRTALASGVLEEIARPYVAGTTATHALERARDLRRKGLLVSFTHLPRTESETESLEALHDLLDVLGPDAAGAELSVKPSQLGLRTDPQVARMMLAELAARTEDLGARITLEMQGPKHYDETVALWEAVQADVPGLGLTLPVDIARTESELRRLLPRRPHLRLCIGSYPVPKGEGIRREHDKQRALVRCIRLAVEGGASALVATHDPTVIAITQDLAARRRDAEVEFQMFLGVRPLEQRRLADIGLRSRVLLPWGPGWYEYLLTRVTARPQTAVGYLRAVIDKR